MFETVATEYGPGAYEGHLYGSLKRGTRVLMRSPEAVMVVGYGVHLIERSSKRDKTVSFDSRAKSGFGENVSYIDRIFGEGASEHALKAIRTRGMGTVLVNGGGEPLPPPHGVRRDNILAEYQVITPTMQVEIIAKGCRQCGSPLRPHTVRHDFAFRPVEGQPRTLTECQPLSNHQVIAVRGYSINQPHDWWPYISSFESWDGESYVDEHFCNDRCAAEYGRRAVNAFPPLDSNDERAARPRHQQEWIKHYEPEVRTITTADGTVFKI